MVKMEVIGNLGKDATENTVNGKKVINFSVAHTEKYNNAKGESMQKTLWVECAYWTEKTGVLPYLLKGTQVWVTGGPDIRTWEGKDGKNGASLTLRVQQIQLLGSAEKKEPQQQNGAQPHPLGNAPATAHPLGGQVTQQTPTAVVPPDWDGNPDNLPF